jgi:DNA-binding response OmpR family regulator
MEVITGNAHKDSQMAVEFSPQYSSGCEVGPSIVLLVDDDPDIRSLTRTFLDHEGYSVFSTGDAERATQIFRSVPRVDLLVADIHLPGRSGLDLARELKALRNELAVLVISGGVVQDAQIAGVQDEGWSFLAKPFRLTELLATVHRILVPVEARRWREAQRGVAVDALLRRD